MATDQRKQLPLENPAQERAVLGCLIGDAHTYWTIRDRLRAEMFVSEVNRSIVETLHKLADSNRSFTIPQIVNGMPPAQDDFEPEAYLAMLCSSDADPEDVGDNLDDLESMWTRRRTIEIATDAIKNARVDDGKPASEKLDDLARRFDSVADPLTTGVKHLHAVAMRLADGVQDAFDADEQIGLGLPLAKLEELIGPLLGGTLYLLGGSPGAGKTALAEQIAIHVARPEAKTNVLFESLEMPDHHIARRHISRQTGIRSRNISRAVVNESELGDIIISARDLKPFNFYVDSERDMSVSRIRAKAMRLKRQKGLGLLIVDHLLYIRSPEPKMDVVAAVRPNLRGLKKIAVDLDIPVVCLTQLKAEFDAGPWSLRRPGVGDLFGGSGVTQEVDVIAIIHRHEYNLARKKPDKDAKDFGAWVEAFEKWRGKAELILGKNRDDEGVSSRVIFFEAERTTFHDHPSREAVSRPIAEPINYDLLAPSSGWDDL